MLVPQCPAAPRSPSPSRRGCPGCRPCHRCPGDPAKRGRKARSDTSKGPGKEGKGKEPSSPACPRSSQVLLQAHSPAPSQGARTRGGPEGTEGTQRGCSSRRAQGTAKRTHILPLGADVSLGAPDATATLQWERAGGISAAPSAQGMGLMGTEREGVPGEPLSTPGSGARLEKRGCSHCPGTVGYLPALPSRPAPLEVPWGLPCPAGEKGLSAEEQGHPPTRTQGEGRALTGRPAAPTVPTIPL